MRWKPVRTVVCVASLALACDDAAPPASPVEAGADVTPTMDLTPLPDAAAPDVVPDVVSDVVPDVTTDDVAPRDTLLLRLFRVPDNTPAGATIHLAGDFNGWSPNAPDARFERDGLTLAVRVRGLSAGQRVAFKVTRGSWATVERDDAGRDIPNRAVTFDPAHPITALYVERWADLAAPASTRSGDVRVLRGVPIPQLGRARDVWVYLPPGYDAGSARYPVMYLYDGQNVFDARASAFGNEWRVDEALEAMHHEGRHPGVIAVAVANGPERPCEYNVFAGDPHPGCADRSALGDRTNAFLVETLKPRIDREYRTLPERASTAVVGSSMGGSMAVRLGFSRPDLFSRVAALSPSYQNTLTASPGMPDFVRAQRPSLPFRLHQDIGSVERIRDLGPDLLARNMMAVRDAARAAGLVEEDNRALVVPGAVHDEPAWAARIGEVLAWLWR
jgi:predicted alpha/beta superfamily hydrolase